MSRTFPRLALSTLLALLCAGAVLFALDPAALPVARAAGQASPQATTLTVTTNADSGPGSLRDALVAAAAGDSIVFSLTANSVIMLTSGELTVTQPIFINGATAVNLAVSGNHASRVFNVSAQLSIVGLTIRDGNATGDGGGINSTDALTLTGVTLYNNVASNNGGGLSTNDQLTLSNTQFVSNTANAGGGASAALTTQAIGGQFLRNTAGGSGGGLQTGDLGYLTGTQFISNSASQAGGGILAAYTLTMNGGLFQLNRAGNLYDGGGVYAYAALVLSGTQFVSNSASYGGGGAYAQGEVRVTGGLFQGNANSSGWGGGLYAQSALALTRTQFIANWASYGGGGVYQIGSDAGHIVNSLFAGNSTDSGLGDAIGLASGGAVQILYTTIATSTQSGNPAIYVGSGNVGITNTVIASYSVGINNNGGVVYEDYDLLFATPITTSGSLISGGVHDVFDDPHFVNPDGGDYHIAFPSAAIDRGANAGIVTDFDGDSRPTYGGFDIGYDEFVGALQRLFLPAIMR